MSVPDTIRWVAGQLAHASQGIDAISGSCPKGLDDAALLGVVLANSIDDAWAARGFASREMIETLAKLTPAPKFSVAVVNAEGFAAGATAATQPPALHVPIGILVEGFLKDTAEANRQAWQLLRCALRSLNLPFNQPGAAPSVFRNGVEIGKPDTVHYPTLERDRSDLIVLAAAIVVFPVYDSWALGA